ncbi:MAG: DUF1320 domain-containing protein [Pseudomonadota bacterium]
MTYATSKDIENAYGKGSLPDGGGTSAAVTAALSAATAEIDTYLAGRYDLPLATPPPILKALCVDIALYKTSLDIGSLTDERRKRYEDALALLRRLADGKADLGLPKPKQTAPSHASFTASPRLFTRQSLRDF